MKIITLLVQGTISISEYEGETITNSVIRLVEIDLDNLQYSTNYYREAETLFTNYWEGMSSGYNKTYTVENCEVLDTIKATNKLTRKEDTKEVQKES